MKFSEQKRFALLISDSDLKVSNYFDIDVGQCVDCRSRVWWKQKYLRNDIATFYKDQVVLMGRKKYFDVCFAFFMIIFPIWINDQEIHR